MRLNNSKYLILVFYHTTALAIDWPWTNKPAPELPTLSAPVVKEQPPPESPPPEIKPYEIPTLRGKNKNFQYIPPIKTVPPINADAVFKTIVNCFPERPKWGFEVKAVAGLRETGGGISTFDTAGLAKYYAGIVAEMPIYSAEEITKQRAQELQRRNDVSQNISKFIKSLADKQRALRLFGIAESVEQRSQYRVNQGIAPAEEQIAAIKQVAEYMADIETATANITAARLALVGQCRDEVMDEVNNYLMRLTK